MEIAVKSRQGPLDVEFQAEEREELESELVEFVDFSKENQNTISGLSIPVNAGEKGGQTGMTEWTAEEQISKKRETVEEDGYSDTEEQLAERIHIDVSDLVDFIEVPENENDRPHIKTWKLEEDAETLGNSRKDRQAKASLMILYTWKESDDVDGVTFETLKRALSDSNIDPARIDTMYTALDGDAEKYIDKPGDRSGKINLNSDGEHRARQELCALVGDLA